MATIDFASPLLGDFSIHLENAFGPTFGWLSGHLIILAILGIVIQSLRNAPLLIREFEITSNVITNFIGYGIFFLVQYQIFLSFSFPVTGALVTAISSTLLWKWTFDTLTPSAV